MLLMLSMGAFAQIPAMWDKPEPKASALTEGGNYYLYNVAAAGFYTGANDYETRASFDPKDGYCVTINKALNGDTWDNKSYLITYTIKTGGDAGKEGTIKILDYGSIWIDELLDGPDDKYLTFEAQGANIYRIGLSPMNTNYFDEGVYLGIKKDQHNDTRFYFLDTEVEDFTDYGANISWKLVSESDFEAYVEALQAYETAKKLREALVCAEVTFPDLDTSEEIAVFETIGTDAGTYYDALANLTNRMITRADAEHPADMTPLFLADNYNLDYANYNEGWDGTAAGHQSCRGVEFYNKNYDAYTSVTSDLEEGFYQVSLDAFYRAGYANNDATEWGKLLNEEEAAQNASIYATTNSGTYTALLPLAHDGVTSEEIGDDASTTTYGRIPNNMWTASLYFENYKYQHPAKVIAYVDGSEPLTFGVKKTTTIDGDWTFLYGWHVAYLGDRDDAAQLLRDQHLAAYPDYVEMQANHELLYYSPDLFATYSQAYNALKEATTKDDIIAAIPAFDEQAELMKANVDAYAAYADKMFEAETFYAENSASLMGEGMDLLGMYIFDEAEPSTEIPFPNGTGLYILTYGTLSTADIITETAYVQQLMDDALASGMTDGMDCTSLIKNPHFAEEGVWTKEGLPEWPAGPDSYKMGQAYTILFNVYQDITGLQEGLYELSLSDFFRPANYGSADYANEPKAYVYMNDFKKNLNSMESGATEGTDNGHSYYIEGAGYVPNTLDEAAASFSAGNYRQSLYGLVTDGTMRIGVNNNLRYEGCWAVWSDFKLTFRAKNPEVLAEVIEMTVPEAQDILGNHFGVTESLALDAAIIAAQDTEGEARYDAMVSLKNAMDAAQECIKTYGKLSEAISNLQQAIDETPGSPKLEEANRLLSGVQIAYNNGEYDNAAALEAIATIGEMVVAVRIGEGGGEEQDFSDLIVNRDFNPDPEWGSKSEGWIKGWTTTAMNGYKEHTVSYNRTGFHLYQTINGLPKGRYKVTVHTYYRAGYWYDEEAHIANGEETHLTTLYAETSAERFETPVMNLNEDAQPTDLGVNCYQLSNGLYAPDGTTPTAAFFAAGHYLNELEFTVPEDGTVTIGLVKTEVYPNDYEVVGEWNLYFYPEVREDYTSLIVNPDFNPSPEWGSKSEGWIKGWTTTAMNGYKEHTVSYNRTGFHLYQTINGLPKGRYKVTVHTYYRAGYWYDEEAHIANGEETHLTTLYAETSAERFETPVMNLNEDAQPTDLGVNCYQLSNGLYAPDGTTPTAAFFAAGHYLNTLPFDVPADGKARIGLIKTEVYPNDYEVVGAWNLWYLGKGGVTGIEPTIEPASKGVAVEFYTLSGVRLDRPQPGINIVRMSDGTVRKVYMK